MSGLFTFIKLLVSRNIKIEKGQIKIKKEPVVIVPSFLISEITNEYLKNNKKSKLYFLSWVCGFNLMNQLDKEFNLNSPSRRYDFGMSFIELSGFGMYKTHEYKPGRYTHFQIHKNPIAEYLKGLYNFEVDIFFSGLMAGGGCFVHQEICQNIEISCIARGDKYCDFITGTEKYLIKTDHWDTIHERYNLDNILPYQKELWNKKDLDNLEEISLEILHSID